MSEHGEGFVGVYKGGELRVIAGGAKGGIRMSGWCVLVAQPCEMPSANLQEIAFYPFKNLCLDTSRNDTCQTEKPEDNLHFRALRNHIFDCSDLVCYIIRRKEI
jgi:hypothetical protein